jgi:hypothetical protein
MVVYNRAIGDGHYSIKIFKLFLDDFFRGNSDISRTQQFKGFSLP